MTHELHGVQITGNLIIRSTLVHNNSSTTIIFSLCGRLSHIWDYFRVWSLHRGSTLHCKIRKTKTHTQNRYYLLVVTGAARTEGHTDADALVSRVGVASSTAAAQNTAIAVQCQAVWLKHSNSSSYTETGISTFRRSFSHRLYWKLYWNGISVSV